MERSNLDIGTVDNSFYTFNCFVPFPDSIEDESTREFVEKLRQNPVSIKVVSYSRYYKSKIGSYADLHPQTVVIKSKHTADFEIPDAWADAVTKMIESYFNYPPDIITVVPSKSGQEKRMEKLLPMIEKRLESIPKYANCKYLEDLIEIDAAMGSNKSKGHAERLIQTQKHLKINPKYDVQNKRILVVDDVLTTGSTFYWIKKKLLSKNPAVVLFFAISRATP